MVAQLRENHYDFAVLLESAPRYREMLERACIRDIRSFQEIPFAPGEHSVINNLRVAGMATEPEESIDLDVTVLESARQWANELVQVLPRPRIGIHAGYGPARKKKGQTERLRGWSTGNFIEVATELARSGASLIFTGAAEDRAVCEVIAAALPAAQVRIVAGNTDLDQLPAIIQSLDLMISVDSGPAHIAAAVGTPLVVLWGPGILAQTRPISSTTPIEILNAAVPCAPCYGTPLMKTCTNNICMHQIRPEQVLATAERLLTRGGGHLLSR